MADTDEMDDVSMAAAAVDPPSSTAAARGSKKKKTTMTTTDDSSNSRNRASYRAGIRIVHGHLVGLDRTDDRHWLQLDQLESAYDEASQHIVLTEAEWQRYLGVHLLRRLRLNRPLRSEELKETLDLHYRATRESVGVPLSLIAAYMSLLLVVHGQSHGIAALTSSAQLLDGDDSAGGVTMYDPLEPWTRVTGPPLLYAVPGAYAPEGILPLLPPANTDAAAAIANDMASEDSVRNALRDAHSRCSRHFTQSHKIWNLYKNFELAHLQRLSEPERSKRATNECLQLYLARLKVPHQKLDQTFQQLSNFVSTRLPASEYEATMASANKTYAATLASSSAVSSYEDALLGASGTYYSGSGSAWSKYISAYTEGRSSRGKQRHGNAGGPPTVDADDEDAAVSLFERCLSLFGLPLSTVEQELITVPPDATYDSERKKRDKAMSWQDRAQRDDQDAARWAQAESLWEDFASFLSNADQSFRPLLSETWDKTMRALPGSGLLITQHMRSLAALRAPKTNVEALFNEAIASGQCAERGTENLVKLLVGRVDIEREYAAVAVLEAMRAQRGDEETDQGTELDIATAHAEVASSETHWAEVYAILEYVLSILDNHVASGRAKQQQQPGKGHKRTVDFPDPKRAPDGELTLQRYMTAWAERLGEAGSALVEPMWANALDVQGGIHIRVWHEAAKFYARAGNARRARELYKQASARRFPTRASGGAAAASGGAGGAGGGATDGMQALIQAKTALLHDWVSFEHSYGSASDVQHAMARSKAETAKLWDAYYQRYASEAQAYAEQAGTSAAAEASQAMQDADMSTSAAPTHQAEASAIETPQKQSTGKRKAVDDDDAEDDDGGGADTSVHGAGLISPSTESGKRVRSVQASGDSGAHKRDREHSSVVVGNLPPDATQDEVRALFSRCGRIENLTGPSVLADGQAAALVEFAEATSVTSALTRNGRPLRDDSADEISVALGHECTLYVTNFPESMTDAELRARFSAYGAILDVRWPSKKFAEKRRFAYVQYAQPSSARAALVENGLKLSENTKLLVALSDPDRRKKRSDADANLRELYVVGLPRASTVLEEVRALFERYGRVDDVRIPPLKKGKDGGGGGLIQGVAFIDMHTDLDAQRAMRELNSTTYRGRVLSVTLAAPRGAGHVRPTPAHVPHERGAGGEAKARSVIVRGLPLEAQEGLIQQVLETALGTPGGGSVKRVDWTPGDPGRGIARVELKDAAVAGKLLLLQGVSYDESHPLTITPAGAKGGAAEPLPRNKAAASSSAGGSGSSEGPSSSSGPALLVPRAARGAGGGPGRGRGRGGLGFVRPPAAPPSQQPVQPAAGDSMDVDAPASSSASASASVNGSTGGGSKKGQDAFRAMLGGGGNA